MWIRLLQALVWSIGCSLAVAASGVVGQRVGARFYPQWSPHVAATLLFIVLGLIAGLVAGVKAMLARPQWSLAKMFGFVILVAFSYGGLTFEYSRHNARPPGISLTFDPYVGTAVRCVAATCHQTDPPLQWTVHGFVQVHSWVRGGTIDAIVLSSGEVELLTFPGPDVRLTGNEIIGVHEIAPNRVASYPVQYSYRTRDGNPPRDVLVSVEFTDATGRQDVGREVWRVR